MADDRPENPPPSKSPERTSPNARDRVRAHLAESSNVSGNDLAAYLNVLRGFARRRARELGFALSIFRFDRVETLSWTSAPGGGADCSSHPANG